MTEASRVLRGYAAGKLCRCRAHNRLCQSILRFLNLLQTLSCGEQLLMDFVLFFFFRNEFGFGAGGGNVSASRRWGWWRRSRRTIEFVCSGQQRIGSFSSGHCCLSRTGRPAAADPAGEWRFSSLRVIYVYVTQKRKVQSVGHWPKRNNQGKSRPGVFSTCLFFFKFSFFCESLNS